MSPFPEVSCDSRGNRTFPPREGASGLIHAVIVPPAVAAPHRAARASSTCFRHSSPTSIGPAPVQYSNPPPPRCASEPSAHFSESICPRRFARLTMISRLARWRGRLGIQIARTAICPARMWPPPVRAMHRRRYPALNVPARGKRLSSPPAKSALLVERPPSQSRHKAFRCCFSPRQPGQIRIETGREWIAPCVGTLRFPQCPRSAMSPPRLYST